MATEYSWKLHGDAGGRCYNEMLAFVKKEITQLPSSFVEEHMRSLSRFIRKDPNFDEGKYRETISKQEIVVFRNKQGGKITLSPRYAGSCMGDNDDGKGRTICSLIYNGKYVALALYDEVNKDILAMDY